MNTYFFLCVFLKSYKLLFCPSLLRASKLLPFVPEKLVPSCINIRKSKESGRRNWHGTPGKGRIIEAHKGGLYFLRGVVDDGMNGIEIMIRRPQVKQSRLKIQMGHRRNSLVQLVLEKVPPLHKLHMLLLLEQILSPTMSLDALKNINGTGYAVIQRRQQNIPPGSILLHKWQTQHLGKWPKWCLPHTPCIIHQSLVMLRAPIQMGRWHPPHALQNRPNNGAFKLPGLREHMPSIATVITHSLRVPRPNSNHHVLERHRLMVPVEQQQRSVIQVKNIHRHNPTKILLRHAGQLPQLITRIRQNLVQPFRIQVLAHNQGVIIKQKPRGIRINRPRNSKRANRTLGKPNFVILKTQTLIS